MFQKQKTGMNANNERREQVEIVIINKKKLIIITILIIAVIIITSIDIPTKIQKIMYKKEYSEYVEKYSQEYNVDENLVYAVIKAESNFNPNAKSSKDAIGLMQLVESTAKEICKKVDIRLTDDELREKLFEPEININLGTKYLSILIEKYQNVEIEITAYNAGIGTVDKKKKKSIIKSDGSDIENIPYKETNNYVRKILRDYKIYTGIFI